MKIAVLSTWFPYPPDNGSKLRAHYLVDALAKRHEVTLAAFLPAGQQPNFGDLPERLTVQPVADDPFRYVNVSQMRKFLSPAPLVYHESRAMDQTIGGLAGLHHWDAVVSLQAPVGAYVRRLAGVPAVLDMDTSLSFQTHETYQVACRPHARLRYLLSWHKARCYEAKLLRAFDACTVVSAQELSYMRSLARDRCPVRLVPNGVDCHRNRPGMVQKQAACLVYNGALTYKANFDAVQYFLAGIFPLIREALPQVSLHVTGSTHGVPLSELQLNEQVRLTGNLPDVRSTVAAAAVCIVPIRQGGGTRLKILEAMALGTPVVATSRGAEGLDVTPGRDILIADEPARFAACVLRLLQDAELRLQLATHARRLVEERYDWSVIGADFVGLVEAVAGRKQAEYDLN